VQPDDSFSGFYRLPQPGRNQLKAIAVDRSGGRGGSSGRSGKF